MRESLLIIFKEICQILCRCEQLKGDIISLHGEHVQVYQRTFKHGTFLSRIDHYFFQIYVVQVCMILNSKEPHSLKKLMISLLNDMTDQGQDESESKIQAAIERIEYLETEHLRPLKTLRDKFWAHRDLDRNDHKVSIKYQDAWKILEELQSIFNIVNSIAFNAQTQFHTLSDRTPGELIHLDKYSKMWERLRPERYKPSNDVVSDLIYLMRGLAPNDFKR